MNKVSTIVITTATTVIGGSLLFHDPVSADTTKVSGQDSIKQNSNEIIPSYLEKIANPYVSFNTTNNQFVLNTNIKNVVTDSEFKSTEAQITATNNAIRKSLQSSDNVIVEDPKDNAFTITDSNNNLVKAAGKTDIKFHWNYACIYLSKPTLKTAVAVVGGVYAPAKIIQAACGIVGLNVNKITSGIWFDYNYAAALVGNAGIQ
jgi:hypothetical protein